MNAYYNEHDPFAAAWLRELIADGLIAPGEVDERSIEDVKPSDLAGFVQCHFFAGIGIWSLALRQAGWPDDEPIWTGSCPCQPFSAAGKGGGFADERHLWPAFHWLIEQCRPELVLGEQVASKDGLAWLDLVSADVEASGYAFGAVDTCAAGFGAPHIRQRLYWMADAARELDYRAGNAGAGWRREHSDGSAACSLADANDTRLALRSRPAVGRGTIRHEGQAPAESGIHGRLGHAELPSQERLRQHGGEILPEQETEGPGLSSAPARRLADPNGGHSGTEGLQRSGEQRQQPQDGGAGGVGNADGIGEGSLGSLRGRSHTDAERGRSTSGVELASSERRERWQASAQGHDHDGPASERPQGEHGLGLAGSYRLPDRPGPLNGLWRDADWLCCTDGKWRPVAPGAFPLAPSGSVRNRVGQLRGAGNAINLAQAVGFIEAVMEVRAAASESLAA